ncbi:MAG: hypothetical protein HC896_02700 [Bacteroidales bacterium]|nr:hypothetical protein [Bacteroidales bacterium]
MPRPIYNILSDDLNNIYLHTDNEIIKYIFPYTTYKKYQNRKIDASDVVDASNPLRILYFDAQDGMLLLLSSEMSEMGRVDIGRLAGFDPGNLVCQSGQGSFWLYNAQLNECELYDKNNQVAHSTNNLYQVIDHQQVVKIKEVDRKLYVFTNLQRMYAFDGYGSLLYQAPKKGTHVHMIGNIMFLRNNSTLYYNGLNNIIDSINLNIQGNFYTLNNKYLFVVTNEKLMVSEHFLTKQ